MQRKLRFVLPVLVVLLALPGATAHAVARMPVGFFDDPSFRWASETSPNLLSTQRTHSSIVHILANWSTIAPTRPRNALNGNDPGLPPLRRRRARPIGAAVRVRGAAHDRQTPKWANGGKTPNYPPTNMNDLTQFAQMLATRYNGTKPGVGTVRRFSVWNEPNLGLFLAPQFARTGRSSARRPTRSSTRPRTRGSRPATRTRWSRPVRRRTAGRTARPASVGPTRSRRRRSPACSPRRTRSSRSTRGRRIRTRPSTLWARPERRVPERRLLHDDAGSAPTSTKWFHRRVPIWVTEYGEQTTPEYPRSAASATPSRPPTSRRRCSLRRRTRTSRCSSGSSSATAPPRRGSAASCRRTGRRSRPTAPSQSTATERRRVRADDRPGEDVLGHAPGAGDDVLQPDRHRSSA